MTADWFCAEKLLFLFYPVIVMDLFYIYHTTPWIISLYIIGKNLIRDKSKKYSFTEVKSLLSFLITDNSIDYSQLIMQLLGPSSCINQ